MDNLVWAEQQIRELKERVERLERILELSDRLDDDSIGRILEEFEVESAQDKLIEENLKLISQRLAAINIHRPELDAMLTAYAKSIKART